MVDKDGKKVDIMNDLIKLEVQMGAYIQQIELLLDDVRRLDGQYVTCFQEINPELPKVVKDQRKQRALQTKANNSKALKRPPNVLSKTTMHTRSKTSLGMGEEQKDMTIYQMISLSCKYKKRIQGMLKDLKDINKRRKILEDDNSEMRKEVFKIKQIKLYKPVRGDVVDEMFAGFLNKAKIAIDVQRISASNYMFGTKKILAKIINGNLVIRVGGGYMNAEEFIEQYGKIEMMKIMKIEENKNILEGIQSIADSKGGIPTSRQSMRPSTQMGMTMGIDIKEKMRQTLLNVKTYESHKTMDTQIGASLQKSLTQSKNKNKNSIDMTNELKSALTGLKAQYKKPSLMINTEEDKLGISRKS